MTTNSRLFAEINAQMNNRDRYTHPHMISLPPKPAKYLYQEIKATEKEELSKTDIEYFTKGRVTVMSYLELPMYPTIEEALGYYQMKIIHFPTKSRTNGHYTAVWIYQNVLHFYDSYGFSITKDIYLSDYLTHATGEKTYNYLLHFVEDWKKRGGTVDINSFPHQSITDPNISTCGRHCIVRLYHYRLSNVNYNKFLRMPGINPDDIVTLMTWLIL